MSEPTDEEKEEMMREAANYYHVCHVCDNVTVVPTEADTLTSDYFICSSCFNNPDLADEVNEAIELSIDKTPE